MELVGGCGEAPVGRLSARGGARASRADGWRQRPPLPLAAEGGAPLVPPAARSGRGALPLGAVPKGKGP